MTSSCFRKTFAFPTADKLSWFPGHMMRGMNKMQQVLKYVDCLFEVHDARIPFTGRNKTFKHRIGIKPRILLLCKSDLADLSKTQKSLVRDRLMVEEDYKDVMFVNAKVDKDPVLRGLVARAVEIVNSEDRYNREYVPDYRLMVCGIPNVGKSSVINAMRRIYMARKKHKASEVGAKPGVTRALMERVKIVDYPPVFLYDTPGILPPSITNVETGLRLALYDYVKPSVEPEVIADYLLYELNKHQVFNYVSFYGLLQPTDEISIVLNKIAEDGNMKMTRRNHVTGNEVLNDWCGASLRFLTQFRRGLLGNIPFNDIKGEMPVSEDKVYEAEQSYAPENNSLQSPTEHLESDSSNEQKVERRLIGNISHLISSSV